MATNPGGVQLPLDPNIQPAVDLFNTNKAKYIRTAVLEVLYEDLKKEVEQALKNAGLI